MFSLSTIVIAVCDVIIVVCFILLALRYRKLVERVSTMRDNLDFCHHSLVNYMIDLNEIRSFIAFDRRVIDSLSTDVRKLNDALSFLENSHVALRTVVSDLTCKEVKSNTTKKITNKIAKNGKK